MKGLASLLVLSGCYIGAHGSLDTAVRARSTATAAPEGSIDIGFGGGDDHQAFALLMGIGVSPLVGRNEDTSPVRQEIFTLGGFYQRAITTEHPNVRWFARLMLGGSMCGTKEQQSNPDASCMSEEQRRASEVLAMAVGVALTATSKEQKHHELTPAFGTVGLGLVYTYASDETLGTGDFLGLELSVGVAGDIFGPMMTKKDD
jgi:hypothetical protein